MRKTILNSPVDDLSMSETLDRITQAIKEQKQIHHVVINAAKIVNMHKNPELSDAVKNCDLINADGQSVIWASRILKDPLKERVAGIDLMHNLVNLAHQNGYKIFFLGAKPEIVQLVVENYTKQYSGNIIAGYRDGYFGESEELNIVKSIVESGAQILLVAISSPKKEIFLNRYKYELNGVNFIMGVGGSFDVVAGKVKRAPIWMQRSGLEWAYRLFQEPKRMWKRYLVTNTLFIWMIFEHKMALTFGKTRKS